MKLLSTTTLSLLVAMMPTGAMGRVRGRRAAQAFQEELQKLNPQEKKEEEQPQPDEEEEQEDQSSTATSTTTQTTTTIQATFAQMARAHWSGDFTPTSSQIRNPSQSHAYFTQSFATPRGVAGALCGVASQYDAAARDRQFRFQTCYPAVEPATSTSNNRLSAHYAGASGWTVLQQDFQYSCPRHAFVSRVDSFHHEQLRDRTFHFSCSTYAQHSLVNCQWQKRAVNQQRGAFEFESHDGHVIAGIASDRDPDSGDRVYYFRQCAVAQHLDE